MNWFRRKDKKIKEKEKSIPDGLWDKCKSCNEIIYLPELEKNLFICHHCGIIIFVSSLVFYKDLLLDKGTAKQHFERLRSVDFLEFKINKSYENQLFQAREKTGDADAIKVYVGETIKYQ